MKITLEDTAWIAITAIAVVGIIAMVIFFGRQQPTTMESAVSYVYDEKNRLKSVVPMASKLD